MREKLLKALLSHAQGELDKHLANVEVYLQSPVGVGEHIDVVETMEKELLKIADYDAQIEMLSKYFNDVPEIEEDFSSEERDI
tara:strand:+ start:367 stop:615 length:249 start_codon:yes stop_codon:yes gene_type:complete